MGAIKLKIYIFDSEDKRGGSGGTKAMVSPPRPKINTVICKKKWYLKGKKVIFSSYSRIHYVPGATAGR